MSTCVTGSDYPWYQVVSNTMPLTQGDIVYDCPVPLVVKSDSPPFYKIGQAEVPRAIVITQACDLANAKVKELAICPVVTLTEVLMDLIRKEYNGEADYNNLQRKQRERKQKMIEALKQGHYLDFHLLSKFHSDNPELNLGYQVVLLRDTYRLPVDVLNFIIHNKGGLRIQLLPPYREHLAQAYSRNYHRIVCQSTYQ